MTKIAIGTESADHSKVLFWDPSTTPHIVVSGATGSGIRTALEAVASRASSVFDVTLDVDDPDFNLDDIVEHVREGKTVFLTTSLDTSADQLATIEGVSGLRGVHVMVAGLFPNAVLGQVAVVELLRRNGQPMGLGTFDGIPMRVLAFGKYVGDTGEVFTVTETHTSSEGMPLVTSVTLPSGLSYVESSMTATYSDGTSVGVDAVAVETDKGQSLSWCLLPVANETIVIEYQLVRLFGEIKASTAPTPEPASTILVGFDVTGNVVSIPLTGGGLYHFDENAAEVAEEFAEEDDDVVILRSEYDTPVDWFRKLTSLDAVGPTSVLVNCDALARESGTVAGASVIDLVTRLMGASSVDLLFIGDVDGVFPYAEGMHQVSRDDEKFASIC